MLVQLCQTSNGLRISIALQKIRIDRQWARQMNFIFQNGGTAMIQQRVFFFTQQG
jgi:hypothetical protein